jgi:hypothetical protein
MLELFFEGFNEFTELYIFRVFDILFVNKTIQFVFMQFLFKLHASLYC